MNKMICFYLIFIIYLINFVYPTFQYAQSLNFTKENETSKSSNQIFEDDMILTESDIKLLFGKNNDSQDIKTIIPKDNKEVPLHIALAPTSPKRWINYFDNGTYFIPYHFDVSVKASEKDLILRSMNSISSHTCIKFKKHTRESNYLNFQSKSGDGCFSYVGMRGGKQIIQLGSKESSTCFLKRIVIHELLHAVGLYHEHMRNDRDDYVTIHAKNIKEGAEIQFEKIIGPGVSTYHIPYDYLSIMHYGKNFFAKSDDLVTIEPKDKRFLNLIGKEDSPSSNDWNKVCEMYQCEICNNISSKIFKNKLDYFLIFLFLLILKEIFY